jgi:hypothetical protein
VVEQLYIHRDIVSKCLIKHNVSESEINEAWQSYDGMVLVADDREEHRTNPPTIWFVARTVGGRKLKVIVVIDTDGIGYLKSAYEANQRVINLFRSMGGKV